ncbi:MAG: UvrD-helicase domain-containing protein [Acidimicrobiia bacterium]
MTRPTPDPAESVIATGAQHDTEIASEQRYVDAAYERLDAMRAAARRVEDGYREVGRGGTHQARLERDAAVDLTRRRLSALEIGDRPLVFGRLDLEAGDPAYVGRVGVDDESREALVVDWRAPVAAPFYRATALEPLGVVRRRHFQTRGRVITGLDDEVFDADRSRAAGHTLVGEGALLRAISGHRTGRMGDIVATIQADQDRAIRAPLAGALIVNGGPGTGKTAVALHRAAYLLYTHRERLAGRGVLFIGPSPVFLRYVEEVLPSLGEGEARLTTIERLRPTIAVRASDPPAVERLKGDVRMADVLAAALRDRQRPLPRPVHLRVDGHRVTMTPSASRKIVRRALRRRGTHNSRRPYVEQRVLDHLERGYLRVLAGRDDLSVDDRSAASAAARGEEPEREWSDDLRRRIRERPETREILERIWPVLSGAELLREMSGFPELVKSAATGILTRDEQELIVRDRGPDLASMHWSVADVALIDEADELLGPTTDARPWRPRRAQDEDSLEVAGRVVEELGLSGMVSAAEIARRYGAGTPPSAPDDDVPGYGHVLVDEAQDLSPMQWRMVRRRAPGRSLTLVGDFGQASRPGAAGSWEEVLDVVDARSSTTATLTVNYRTPAEIMEPAVRLLRASGPGLTPPEAVRHTGTHPRFDRVDLHDRVRSADAAARASVGGNGTVAVIAPGGLCVALGSSLGDLAAGWGSPDALDAPIALVTPTEAKGLEFDHVILVEPSDIVGDDRRAGLRRLYVCLTRATSTLTVIHSQPLPEALR